MKLLDFAVQSNPHAELTVPFAADAEGPTSASCYQDRLTDSHLVAHVLGHQKRMTYRA
jgi:hypothetical protein